MNENDDLMQMEITGDKDEARFLIREIRKALQQNRTSREIALAITKLQEAEFWLEEASFGENAV